MEDLQPYIDRMLEIENLTDNLQDEDARWLLDWGTTQLNRLAADVQQDGELTERAAALMKFMRALNRLVGSLPAADPDELSRLLENHSATYGASRPAEQATIDEAVTTLAGLPPRGALEFLISWAEIPDTSP